MKDEQAPVYRLKQSSATGVSVKIVGFDGNCSLGARAIASWLEKVPTQHLHTLKTIEYGLPPQKFLGGLLRRHNRGGGHYCPREHKIVIYPCHNTEVLLHALFHELGHSVYFKVISAGLRKQWVTGLAGRRKYFVSAYARRNAAEDFAECYAFYILESEVVKSSPSKYQFLKQHIFSSLDIKPANPKSLDFTA